jgi:hypothetical protein
MAGRWHHTEQSVYKTDGDKVTSSRICDVLPVNNNHRPWSRLRVKPRNTRSEQNESAFGALATEKPRDLRMSKPHVLFFRQRRPSRQVSWITATLDPVGATSSARTIAALHESA